MLRSNVWTIKRWASLERGEIGMEMDPGYRCDNRWEPPEQIKKEEERGSHK